MFSSCLPYTIQVRADEETLSIVCPVQVNESSPFTAQILLNETPLANATVIFNHELKYSNTAGFVQFIAPRVLPDENITFPLVAYKERIPAVTINISVINRPQLFISLESTTIPTKTHFLVTIIDDEGRIIDNASLVFNTKENYTNSNGTIVLVAPQVNKSKVYNITAAKEGYINNTILIIISPEASSENILGLYIALGILLFIAVFPLVVIIMRHYRRKRINRLK